MAHDARVSLECFGRAAAYTVYNLGVGIILGLARTIISVAYMAKHWFYANQYEQASRAQREQRTSRHVDDSVSRSRENRDARRATRQAKGFNKVGAQFNEWGTRAKNWAAQQAADVRHEVESVVQDARDEAVLGVEKARLDDWKGELTRGLLEFIYVGAPFYTYMDNWHDKRNISVFGLQELMDKIEQEHDFDELIREFVPGYNPWF